MVLKFISVKFRGTRNIYRFPATSLNGPLQHSRGRCVWLITFVAP
ncbi:MAG: hypothetical protein JWR61_1336 [Ferruginibacter sp.]|nr:hypothetical protein [Ferruginibacter sp.]